MKIFKRIRRFFRMRYARTIVKITKGSHSSRDLGLTDIQKTALTIFNKLVRDVDAELLYAPLSDKLLIQKGNIFLSVNKASNGCILNISGIDETANMNYHYDVWLGDYCYYKIKTRFTKSVDKRRSDVETELVNRDKESLQKILNDIRKNEN